MFANKRNKWLNTGCLAKTNLNQILISLLYAVYYTQTAKL